MKVDCPFCFPEVTASLTVLQLGDEEYNLSVKTNDGTKKWYKCSHCEGTFCRDKLRGVWQLSPNTYIKFIEKGWVKDLINT